MIVIAEREAGVLDLLAELVEQRGVQLPVARIECVHFFRPLELGLRGVRQRRGADDVLEPERPGIGNDLVGRSRDRIRASVHAHGRESDGLEERADVRGALAIETREFDLAESHRVEFAQRAFEIFFGLVLHGPHLDSQRNLVVVVCESDAGNQ
jgi:hypothetical protein